MKQVPWPTDEQIARHFSTLDSGLRDETSAVCALPIPAPPRLTPRLEARQPQSCSSPRQFQRKFVGFQLCPQASQIAKARPVSPTVHERPLIVGRNGEDLVVWLWLNTAPFHEVERENLVETH